MSQNIIPNIQHMYMFGMDMCQGKGIQVSILGINFLFICTTCRIHYGYQDKLGTNQYHTELCKGCLCNSESLVTGGHTAASIHPVNGWGRKYTI